jgi:hypothetical protein
MTSTALIHKPDILHRVAQGERLSDIGANLGVTAQALSKVLKDDSDYLIAKEVGHATRLDLAERKIEEAVDQVDVTRARALWGAYSWRAEREFPSKWGQQRDAPITIVPVIHIHVDSAAIDQAQAIEGQVVDKIVDK